MKKPTTKTVKLLDYSECERFINQKYRCDIRDFADSHSDFDNWCKAHNEKRTTCDPNCSESEMKEHQAQFARYKSCITSGTWIERPYQDFWHWLIDAAGVSRGGTIELDSEMGDGAEPWIKQILGYFLTEFGKGPYLTDW